MTKIIGLEKYYGGDDSWNSMVELAELDFWDDSNFQQDLNKMLNNNKDLAMVVFARLQYDSLNWISRSVPALGNLKPLDCLHDINLIKRLRECLMRMH